MPQPPKQKKWKGQTNIARSAVEAFLQQPREDWYWLKEHGLGELQDILQDYQFSSHTNPRLHQAVCILLGILNQEFIFLLDMGLGKTWIALNLIQYHLRKANSEKWLALVTSDVAIESWMQQAKEHTPQLKVMPLVGSRKEREDILQIPADLYLLNYAGLQVFMTEHVIEYDKEKGYMKPIPAKVRAFARQWDGVVFDESHLLGNRNTLLYRLCHAISRAAKYRYSLTGTPFGRDPIMLWSQFDLTDHGITLGPTLGLYRAAFFNASQNYWGGMEYRFKSGMWLRLAHILRHRSIRYASKECKDLPPLTRTTIPCHLPKDAEAYYQQVKQQFLKSRGNYREMDNAFMQMRQLASGFLSFKSKDDTIDLDRIELEFYSPKLDALSELLQQIPPDEKVVIFHEFTISGHRIAKTLTESNLQYTHLFGGAKDKPGTLNKFLNDPKCRILLANTACGGSVLNLQIARYMIFYESPVSPIVRQQAEARCFGARQTQHGFLYDLIIKNSVDERILQFVQDGQDLFKAIFEEKVQI